MREGDVRSGVVAADLGPEDALALLRAWLECDGPRHRRSASCSSLLQDGELSHPRPVPPRAADPRAQARGARSTRSLDGRGRPASTSAAWRASCFDACVPAIPYAAASAFLGREKLQADPRATATARGSRWWPTASAACTVSRTRSSEIRDRGVPGFEVEVIGTDADVDRRLPARSPRSTSRSTRACRSVSRACRRSPMRSPRAATTSCTCARPVPAGSARGCSPGSLDLPVARQLPHRAGRLCRACAAAHARLEAMMKMALGHVLRRLRRGPLAEPASRRSRLRAARHRTPSASGDGTAASTSGALRPGACARRAYSATATRINVLYAGRLTKEKGVDLLADAFLAARWRDRAAAPRARRRRPRGAGARASGSATHATFLGWLDGRASSRSAYASADMFLFASQTDTFGQVHPRGPGERAAGRRGRRGRPGVADRDGATGLLTRAERRGARRRGPVARRRPRCSRERLAPRGAGRGP